MSKVDELIQDLCPDGVEFANLGQVSTVTRGKRFVKADMINTGIPCIHYGEIYTHYGTQATETISFVSEERARTLRFANPGDVVLASAGETEEDLGKSVAWLGKQPVAIHDACYKIESAFEPRLLSYYFSTPHFWNSFQRHIATGKISSISVKAIEEAQVPLLPLAVQEEIVRILDQLSESVQELDRELEAEIEAREKQAEFLRNSYLGSDWQTERLGDLVEYSRKRTKSVDLQPGCFTGVENLLQNYAGRIPGEKLPPTKSVTSYKPGDVLLGNIRPYLKKAWLADQCGGTSNDVLVLSIKDESVNQLLATWLYRVIISEDFLVYNVANSRGAKMPRGDKKKILDYQMPLPPLEVQEEIAQKLDALDATFTEYIDNLKRERELRQKQYEYYRDQLFDFKVKE